MGQTTVMKSVLANQQAAVYHCHHPLHDFRIPSWAKELGPELYQHSICLKGLRKTIENLSQDTQPSGWGNKQQRGKQMLASGPPHPMHYRQLKLNVEFFSEKPCNCNMNMHESQMRTFCDLLGQPCVFTHFSCPSVWSQCSEEQE
jgi:hypothetical protein